MQSYARFRFPLSFVLDSLLTKPLILAGSFVRISFAILIVIAHRVLSELFWAMVIGLRICFPDDFISILLILRVRFIFNIS